MVSKMEVEEKRKKVLMISCGGLGKGGVQTVMMNIVCNLSHNYFFDFLLFTDEARYYDSKAQKYGKIYRIPNKKSRWDYYIRFFRILFGVIKIIKQNSYDIIHCNNSFESGICCLAAIFTGVKTRVVHTHTTDDDKQKNVIRRLIDGFYKILLNMFSNVKIACSKKSGDSFFYKNQKVNVLCNSIDLNVFNTDGRTSDGNINFVHVGLLCENKNQVFAVKVIAALKKYYTNIKLIFVGSDCDNYKSLITEEIKKHNLEADVQFLPFDTDIPSILKKSDYMVFPSFSEGFGIVLLEAQASGVPCFVSDTVPKEADAGMCIFYSLNDSPEIWAENIKEHIQNGENYKVDMIPYSLNNYIKKIDCLYGG